MKGLSFYSLNSFNSRAWGRDFIPAVKAWALFMVPQAFQLSSSGQTKFILAWTCVEEAPLSTKRITRGGEEMAAVHDLSLMLLGKHVWRHFTGLTVRPCWDQCSLSNVRGQADSALLDPRSQCYPLLGIAGTAAAGSACHT